MANLFGLIGYPLGHSFSKRYFDQKFESLSLSDEYNLFEIENIDAIQELLSNKNLKGLNVTIPHKQNVIPYLNNLDRSAKLVGAVNVIKNNGGQLTGYNTDYPAFKKTLLKWLDNTNIKALVLGTGGASKAVVAALQDLKVEFTQVSRTSSTTCIDYEELNSSHKLIQSHRLIINTTPLGMTPNDETHPSIPYHLITNSHYLYDLVYNPEETQFLKRGKEKGCKTKNGLEMLYLQAEMAWEIWSA